MPYPDNRDKVTKKEDHRIEKVTTGSVTRKAPSKKKKLIDAFLPEDRQNLGDWLLFDILVPGVKDVIANTISIVLYGEPGFIGGGYRYPRDRRGAPAVRYGGRYENRYPTRQRSDPDYARGFEFDDLEFQQRGDAEMVILRMQEIIEDYGVASILDLYDAAGVGNPPYTADRYGWRSFPARVQRTSTGYIIQMPKAVPFDR